MSAFLLFFCLCTLMVALLAAVSLDRGTAALPGEALLTLAARNAPFIFDYHFGALIAALSFLVLAAPIIAFMIVRHFETTQSPECFFFCLFLLACLCEGTRFFIPLLDLWGTRSFLLMILMHLLFFGRLLAPTSFLFSAIASVSQKTQDSDQNAVILLALSAFLATLAPFNTAHILPDCTVQMAFQPFINAFVLVLYLLSALSLFLEARKNGGTDRLCIAIGFLLLFTGYLVLIHTDSFAALAVGISTFSAGVYLYLTHIHKVYMWQ
jgi:hypothetical protein